MTLFDMTGKVAVITGSTKGIGRAIAERMAEHGAKVVISSRKQDQCDAVARLHPIPDVPGAEREDGRLEAARAQRASGNAKVCGHGEASLPTAKR